MRITSLQLTAFRSFEAMKPIYFGPINVFIGANNAGKSSILRALYLMQAGSESGLPDVRVGYESARILIGLEGVPPHECISGNKNELLGAVQIDLKSQNRKSGETNMQFLRAGGGGASCAQFPAMEPHHFVVPFLAKRKTATY